MLSERFFIKTMPINEAINRLRKYGVSMTAEKLRAGAVQGVYPWVDVVMLKNASFCIYEKMFDQWCKERGFDGEEQTNKGA